MSKKHSHKDNGASAQPTDIPPHDSDTGELIGSPAVAGVGVADPAGSSQPRIDKLEMSKKIVAKDIVGKEFMRYKLAEKPANFAGEWNPLDPAHYPPKACYTVFGTARDTKSGDSTFGQWVSFLGSFEAVRESDGKRFVSNRLFLQNPAQDLLVGKLAEMKAADASGSVQFAFEIGVRVSERWLKTQEGNSYEYTVNSVFQVSAHDPLAAMRSQLSGAGLLKIGHESP